MTSPSPTCTRFGPEISKAYSNEHVKELGIEKERAKQNAKHLENYWLGLSFLGFQPVLVNARVKYLAIRCAMIIDLDLSLTNKQTVDVKAGEILFAHVRFLFDHISSCQEPQCHLVTFLGISCFVAFLVHNNFELFWAFIDHLSRCRGFWCMAFAFFQLRFLLKGSQRRISKEFLMKNGNSIEPYIFQWNQAAGGLNRKQEHST
jgi:hypothetical protein